MASYTLNRAPGYAVLRLGQVDVSRIAWAGVECEPQHEHVEKRVVVALDGTFHERRARTTYRHGPGSVLVRDPHERHSNRYGSAGGVYVSLALRSPALVGAIPGPSRQLAFVPPVGALAACLGAEIVRGDPWSALASHGLALELVAALGRHVDTERDRPPWLDEVCDALREDRRRRWSLEQVARIVGVEPTRLSRTFRRCVGLSVGAYLRHVRVEEARRLIERGRTAIADIADEVGFCDQSHLNRAFREATRLTPGEYRRLAHAVPLRPNADDPSYPEPASRDDTCAHDTPQGPGTEPAPLSLDRHHVERRRYG